MSNKVYFYLEVETHVNGELRGFSHGVHAMDRKDELIPRGVDVAMSRYVGKVLDEADVMPSFPGDYPYRLARYRMFKDGLLVVDSCARRPVKPSILVDV